MYHFKGSRLKNPHLLELPVEIKRLIYSFCYFPPHSLGNKKHGPRDEAKLLDAPVASDNNDQSAYWPAELYTPCQYPRSHLSLYFTCRRLRSELYPVFAAHHIMNMSKLFLSTEESSHVEPVYRLQDVHHIALRFPPSSNTCVCSVYGKGSQQHSCIDLHTDVEKDIRNFISATEACRNGLSLESIELSLPLPCNSTSDAFAQYRALFRSVVYLAEALSQRRHEMARDTRRILVQISWPSNPRNPVKVLVDHIPKTSWEIIPDGTLVLEQDCFKCQTMGYPIECHTHQDGWVDVDDVLSAINGKRAVTLSYPGVDDVKPWKVVFQPGGGYNYFSHAMVELERRRQSLI